MFRFVSPLKIRCLLFNVYISKYNRVWLKVYEIYSTNVTSRLKIVYITTTCVFLNEITDLYDKSLVINSGKVVLAIFGRSLCTEVNIYRLK